MINQLIAVFLLLVLGAVAGYTWEYENHAKTKATLEMERAQAKANADKAREHAERVGADVSVAWANAYDYLNSHPTVRVLRPGCNQGALRPDPTGKANGNTEAPAPDSSYSLTAEQCEARLNDGIKDSAQLLHLQHWISTVGK